MPRRKRSPAAAFLRAMFPAPRRVKKAARRTPAPKKRISAPTSPRARPATRIRSAAEPGIWRSFRYSGTAGSRPYYLYVPKGLRRSTPVPLVVALHGCGQDAAEFAAATRFNRVADSNGFVVAYPEQPMSHNAQHCWNWFRPAHQHRGAGEPAMLAGIVRRIIEQHDLWSIDPDRVYVTGLSAGGAMSAVLAATYPELFAAVGVHSAPGYRAATTVFNAQPAMAGLAPPPPGPGPNAAPMPPMIIFQGSRDHVVSAINADRLADQWLAYNNANEQEHPSTRITRTRTSVSRPGASTSATSRRGSSVRRWYSAGGRKMLEVWSIDGLGHAWSGGAAHGSYSDPRGPRASTEMWRFFAQHHR